MKARAYVHGHAVPLDNANNPGSTILEVELDDGRTVQLVVNDTGHIGVRAWGNIPAKVGNTAQVSFECLLHHETQTNCPVCYGKEGDYSCETTFQRTNR